MTKQVVERPAPRRTWPVPKGHTRPYPTVAEQESFIEPFLDRCQEQEDQLVASGLPIEGITRFYRKWFAAWNTYDAEALGDCWTEDLVWTVSSTGQIEYRGRAYTVELARFGYLVTRRMRFYPWDGSDTHLPYYSYFDGVLRVALPYSGSTAFPWTKYVPWPRRAVQGGGVDRYIMRKVDGEWKVARIDTDLDAAAGLAQLLPFGLTVIKAMAWGVRAAPRVARTLGLLPDPVRY